MIYREIRKGYTDTMDCFDFDTRIRKLAEDAEAKLGYVNERLDDLEMHNTEKVLKAFTDCHVAEMHLKGTTGYGYGDDGRDKLDEVFARVLGAEDALVRFNFVNGTHALSTALFGVLRPGELLLSATGMPYDTLQEVIFGERGGSLKEFGVSYEGIELTPEGRPDLEKIRERAAAAKVVYIQRSRGYSLRPSLTVSVIAEIVEAAKEANPAVIVMVDNCYGELAEYVEPTSVGADLIIGSLIKNLGGGIASTGGYIAGKRELVELCSYRLTTVGTGKEVGCTLGQNREMFMGLFRAPQAVTAALRTSAFACALFDELGFKTYPKWGEYRTDIIAAIRLGTPERLTAFCEGIQAGSPVDSFCAPEAWDMPGYDSKVIMAAGCFTMGSSIELSADAPLREPYAVWMQGATSYAAGKLGVMKAAQTLLDKGLLG